MFALYRIMGSQYTRAKDGQMPAGLSKGDNRMLIMKVIFYYHLALEEGVGKLLQMLQCKVWTGGADKVFDLAVERWGDYTVHGHGL
jgi:hypothetical protein